MRAERYEIRHCGYETPCWVWKLGVDKNGYGIDTSSPRDGSRLAHVKAWRRVNGPVPDGLVMDHLCRNPPCVNPAHLEPVTQAQNVQRGLCTKLTLDDVRAIRASTETERALAVHYGVHHSTIGNIRRGTRWKVLTAA